MSGRSGDVGRKRNIWPWITAGVAAVAILLLGIIIGNRSNNGAPQAAPPSVVNTSTTTTTPPPVTVNTPTTTPPPVTSAATSPLTATRTQAATTAAVSNVWPTTTGHVGVAPSPAFPTALPGWQLHNTWTVMPRAFTGQQTLGSGPNYSSFPSTMNGCDSQRFLVRWRAINNTAQVDASVVDAANSVVQKVTANAGWMDFDGCRTPSFSLPRNATDGSTLTDVTVTVEQLYPGP